MEQILTEAKEKKINEAEWHIHQLQTGEPMFVVQKGRTYGRDVDVSWHPHQKAIHPHLANSFEFGATRRADSKSAAVQSADYHYNTAAQKGFRDEIDHHITLMDDDEFNALNTKHKETRGWDLNSSVKHVTHFHDPDTGEKIGTYKHVIKNDAVTPMFTMSSKYLSDNGISDEAAHNFAKKGEFAAAGQGVSGGVATAYYKAREIYRNKGKKQHLVGDQTGTSKHASFAIMSTPEKASAAHEEHIKETHPDAVVTRHSPTMFIAHKASTGGHNSGKLIHSTVVGNHLHEVISSFYSPDYQSKNVNTRTI